jgi:hypothetical protein
MALTNDAWGGGFRHLQSSSVKKRIFSGFELISRSFATRFVVNRFTEFASRSAPQPEQEGVS